MKKTILVACIACALLPVVASAQNKLVTAAHFEAAADSQKTSNKEDLLTSFMQVAANNLSSSNQNVSLKLSWFALNFKDSVTKFDDKNYFNTAWQRNGNLMVSGGMDKNQHFNSVSLGASYNVVNKRDTTAVNYFANYSKADVAISQIKGKVIKSYQMIVKAALKPDIEAAVKEQLGKKERDQLPAALGQDINGDKGNKGRIQALQRALNEAIEKGNASGIAQAVDDLASIAAYHIIDDALNPFTKSLGKKTPVATKYLTEATLTDLKKALDKDVAGDPYLKTTYNANGLIDVDTKIEQQFRDLIDFTARQPLVVAGYNYSKGAAGKLDVQSLGLDGSWGLNKLGSKKTNQLTASLADTLTSNPGEKTNTFDRDLGVIKAGLNTVLLMSKKESVMELNVGAEDDYIFTKPVTGESANKFMFDATWRVRLPGSPWLKLDLKYDPKSANVFGLFNFTYNLDNSSASGKSSNSTGSSGSGN